VARGRNLVAAGLVVALAGACTSDDGDDGQATTTTTSGAVAPFETALVEGPCPVEVPDPSRVTCGTVTMPEHHAEPDGPTIELAVALIEPSTAAAQPDPLVLLAGGPGSGFLSSLPRLLESPIVEDRVTVLVDHRGTGFSEPYLGCPELDAIGVRLEGLDADDPAARRLQHDAVAACHERLVDDGIDLRAYSYTEIAADLAELRTALGFDEWNLYGISNGGRIAAEVLRRHPEGVRSVVFDASLPPQGNLRGELWPHAQQAFDALFAGCRRDAACHAAFPTLEQTFADLVERLAREPVLVDAADPTTGEPVVVRFDEETGLNALRQAMYDTALIPLLPLYIDRLSGGDAYDEVVGQILGAPASPRGFSHGMGLSVNCQEEIAFLDDGFFDAQAEQLPQLASVIADPTILDDCAVWDVGRADPSIEEPVESEVPALILFGEYDPVHPRSSSEGLAAGLPKSTVIEVPGLGHGTVQVDDCPRDIARAFLVDPTAAPDAGCTATMPAPAWALP
jgi:pimeloyl-ACP methyl ester carboxylesterase